MTRLPDADAELKFRAPLIDMTKLIPALFAVVLLVAGCSPSAPPPPAATAASAKIALADMPQIDAAQVLGHIKSLASDEFEGRKPGSAGEERTVQYLTAEFQKLGLKPGNTDGTFIQKVPLVGITGTEAKPLVVSGKAGATFKWRDDVVAWTKHVADGASIENSELVFVGYGVAAPEYDWDDFKGVDLKGKTLVMLVNDPQVPDAADPSKLDARTFNGAAMTYYGRWTYKFEEAARRGAAGALIIHETGPAGYPFAVVQGNLGEKFDLVTPDKNMGRANIEGWLSLDAAKRLLKMGGQDFDALKKLASTRDFKPVPLGLKASLAVKNTMRTIESRNVLAKLEGTDPALKDEYIVYTAHWDHFGIGELNPKGDKNDKIYNGALDNASGVASMLEMARAFTAVKPAPKRSILFAAVTAEEQGLLGSRYLRRRSCLSAREDAGQHQRRRHQPMGPHEGHHGHRAGSLRPRRLPARCRRRAKPDAPARSGSREGLLLPVRSLQLRQAGRAGALHRHRGRIRRQANRVQQAEARRYTDRDYHKPSDQIKPDWDLAGAVEDAELMVAVGYRVANADKFPEWKPGNEFRAKREEMLRK